MSRNIVLLSWDSVRADHVPLYGYERNTTPSLTAREEDLLVFDDPQVSAVGTPASFSGVFTGDHRSVVMTSAASHWRRVNRGVEFLPEVLQRNGYFTGGFHYNALMCREYGWNRGWDVYEDHIWDDTTIRECGGGDAATDSEDDEDGGNTSESRGVTDRLTDAIDRAGLTGLAVHTKKAVTRERPVAWESMWDDIRTFVETAPEPWFCWILLIDTHHPYYAPEAYHRWSQPGVSETYALNYMMRRREHRSLYRRLVGERDERIVNAYDNTIRYADELFDRLATRTGDDTAIIVHGDHGDEFAEHANYGHRPLMYDSVTRVPLVMYRVGETGRVAPSVSLLDLGDTVLELAGATERLTDRGSLLAPESELEERPVTVQNLLHDDRMVAAVDGDWKVLRHPAGDLGARSFPAESWEAYDRARDPFEQDNRWAAGDYPEELVALARKQLRTPRDPDGDEDGDRDDVSETVARRLEELGYRE